jgi:hypothetical protein
MANKALIESITYMPSGVLLDFAGTTAPTGWAMCDGTEYSKTAFADLFSAIGIAYGETNGSGGVGTTHFRVPDFRGRFARYNDNMGTGAASRDTGRVHGSSQAQATAKNGLSLANTDLSHSHSVNNPFGSSGGIVFGTTSILPNNTSGGGNPGTNSVNLNHSHTLSGDAETRPINLSCNKIIKL